MITQRKFNIVGNNKEVYFYERAQNTLKDQTKELNSKDNIEALDLRWAIEQKQPSESSE